MIIYFVWSYVFVMIVILKFCLFCLFIYLFFYIFAVVFPSGQNVFEHSLALARIRIWDMCCYIEKIDELPSVPRL